jgi:chloramphenicol 3-O-phosphotransferase
MKMVIWGGKEVRVYDSYAEFFSRDIIPFVFAKELEFVGASEPVKRGRKRKYRRAKRIKGWKPKEEILIN